MHLRMQKPMPAGGDKGVKVPDPEVFFKFARMRAEALGFPASDTVFYLASDDWQLAVERRSILAKED